MIEQGIIDALLMVMAALHLKPRWPGHHCCVVSSPLRSDIRDDANSRQ
jgi:hypothetical protein